MVVCIENVPDSYCTSLLVLHIVYTGWAIISHPNFHMLYLSFICCITGPPKITNFPDKVTALSANKVYLNCVAKGYPLPVITWYNNGYKLARTGDKHSILENGTLVFNVIDKLKDQSQYICIATNNAGTHEKSLQLIVSGMLLRYFL